MLKRKIAGLALAFYILGGLAIGWIFRTRTWSHSFDMVHEASPRTLQRWLTSLALAVLATAFSIFCDVSAVWLGIAFDTWFQAAYVTLVILCVAVLWWLCCNSHKQNVLATHDPHRHVPAASRLDGRPAASESHII